MTARRHISLTLLLCLTTTNVFAAGIRDWSLPEDQSLQQPDKPSAQDTMAHSNYNSFLNSTGTTPTGSVPAVAPLPADGYVAPGTQAPATRFMDGYCDPNFRPALSSACLDAQKKQSCDAFAHLPNDAQNVLDQAIGCGFTAGNGDVPDTSCNNSDAQRLQLLRKYERDPTTTHALLSLPDDVLHASEHCMRGAR